MSAPLLQVEDLRAHFHTRRGVVKALDGVSFSVDSGETLGLVGESGSGKTITSLSILRLLPKPAGRIAGGRVLFGGTNLLELSEAGMAEVRGGRISMILQDPMASLNPLFAIGEQVAEPVRRHQKLRGKALWAEVVSALRLLQIPSPETRLRDYPHQLSGGMRQRVVGGIALSCRPELLIADEPTTALDATVQAQFLALLKDVQRETGVAIIFITHDFSIVAKMCDRVAVMYAGKVVETAGLRDLFERPAHPYTRGLLDSIPRLDRRAERLSSIEGQPPALLALPPGCRFAPRCREALERCREAEPPEVPVREGHAAACWRLV